MSSNYFRKLAVVGPILERGWLVLQDILNINYLVFPKGENLSPDELNVFLIVHMANCLLPCFVNHWRLINTA